jgi:cytochrome c biogenesis protein CcdA
VSLLRLLEKAYVFTFYVQYRCATSFGNQKWGVGNAVFGMALLQFLLLSELICGIALLAGHTPFVPSRLVVLFGSAVILMLTHFLLIRRHQWLRFKPEFEAYSRRKHFLASLSVGILMAVALLGIGIVKHAIGTVHS